MIASLHASGGVPRSTTWRERLAVAATVLAWLIGAVLIASSCVGHATSPYGVCVQRETDRCLDGGARFHPPELRSIRNPEVADALAVRGSEA